jgi:hypothetical protein
LKLLADFLPLGVAAARAGGPRLTPAIARPGLRSARGQLGHDRLCLLLQALDLLVLALFCQLLDLLTDRL